ncbi:MAG: thioredoxin [Candidatus Thiodiazotropha sp. (ex Gloverina cf. vestifex)]|nr:thioredoxin [Candidatus Thiodiazotropha sp. (ex Gloverina cf. vestifex)]
MIHITNLTCRTASLLLILFMIPTGYRQALAEDIQLYRCVIDGATEFRQTACIEGDESMIRVTDHSRGMTPSVPGLRLKKVSEKTDRKPKKDNKRAIDERCWKKRRQLERVERKLRAGYKPSEYERLHERQETYASYIRKFCR